MLNISNLTTALENSQCDLEKYTLLKRIAAAVATELKGYEDPATRVWDAMDAPTSKYGCKFTKNASKTTYTYSNALTLALQEVDTRKADERKSGVAVRSTTPPSTPFKVTITDLTTYDAEA